MGNSEVVIHGILGSNPLAGGERGEEPDGFEEPGAFEEGGGVGVLADPRRHAVEPADQLLQLVQPETFCDFIPPSTIKGISIKCLGQRVRGGKQEI